MPKNTAQKYNSKQSFSASKKVNSKTRLGIAAIGFLILVLIIGKLFGFIQSLYEPLNIDSSFSQKNYTWKEEFNLNVVLKGDDIALLSYNPNDKKLVVIPIPSNTLVDVSGGLGKSQIGLVKEPKLLKLSVTSLLGLPVDGLIDITSLKEANTSEKFVKLLRKEVFGFISNISSLKSDLTLMEVWKLKIGMASVRFDKVETWNLEDEGLLSLGKSEDGSKVLLPNIGGIDDLVLKLAEGSFTSNRVNIAVFNATTYPGLAQKGARIITNIGGNVVVVTNAATPQARSYIAVKDNPSGNVVKKVSQLFDLDCSGAPSCSILVCNLGVGENACSTDDLEVTHSRAEVTVVLGEDFYQNYR